MLYGSYGVPGDDVAVFNVPISNLQKHFIPIKPILSSGIKKLLLC